MNKTRFELFEDGVVRVAYKIWNILVIVWTFFYKKVIRDFLYRTILRDFLFNGIIRRFLGSTTIEQSNIKETPIYVLLWRMLRNYLGTLAPFIAQFFGGALKVMRGGAVVVMKDIPLASYKTIKKLLSYFKVPLNLTTTFSAAAFVFVFAFVDRNYVKNLRYPGLYEPNYFWRFVMVSLQFLQMTRYFVPAADVVLGNNLLWRSFKPFVDLIFQDYMNLIHEITLKFAPATSVINSEVLDYTKSLLDIASVVPNVSFLCWLFVRSAIQLNLKRRFPLQLSMYVRYHFVAYAVVSMALYMLESVFTQILTLNDLYQWGNLSEKVLAVIFFLVPDITKIDINYLIAQLYLILWLTMGPSLLVKAILGRTFDDSWYDPLMQAHLGYECLYDDERWSKFGLADSILGHGYIPPYYPDDDPDDSDDDDY